MKIYLAFDIGKQGGIVGICPDHIRLCATPKAGDEISIKGVKEEINWYINTYGKENIIAGAEDVHSIFGASAKSNFQFGRSLGIIEGVLSALEISFVKVAPKTWQKIAFLGIPEMRKPSTIKDKPGPIDTKPMALCAAQRLYPTTNLLATNRSKVPHSGIVDSLLIAHYLKVTNR